MQGDSSFFLHPIDICLVLLLIWGAWKGYKIGLVLVVINTLALVISVIVGFKFLSEASLLLKDHMKGAGMAIPVAAFILLFGITFFSLKWFAGFASRSIKQTLFGPFDQAAGAILGLFRMALMLSSILIGLQLLHIKWNVGQNANLVVLPALQQFGGLSLKLIAPLLPFLKKLL